MVKKLESIKKWRERDPLFDQPEYGVETSYFTLKLNHGGYFSERGFKRYVDANVTYFDFCHRDRTSIASIHEMMEKLGYAPGYMIILWKLPYPRMSCNEVEFRRIEQELDVVDMVLSHLPEYRIADLYIVTNQAEEVENDGSIEQQSNAKLEQNLAHVLTPNDIEYPINEGLSEDDTTCDVELEDRDNEIHMGDDDLDFRMKVPPTMQAERVDRNVLEDEIDVQQQNMNLEAMGYKFHIDTDYEDSDEIENLDSDDSDEERVRFPKFNVETDMKDPIFRTGMLFASFDVLKDDIWRYSITNRYELSIKKNDLQRLRVTCKKGCPWYLYAAPIQDGARVQIRNYIDEHNYSKEFSNKYATYRWIADKCLELIRATPDVKLTTIIHLIKDKYNINVPKTKVHYAKKLALEILRGNENEQFLKLADYGGELRRTNPDSAFILSLHNLIFQRLFVCISGCKNGFMAHCRPVISIDGCHIKGRYGNHVLSAIAIDPNDCIWPIAYGVVEVECTDSWKWFLHLLIEELGIHNSHKWTSMSDRQKGLIAAVQQLIPNAEHRFCVRHLIGNFKKTFPGETLKNTIWAAAQSTYLAEYKRHIEALKSLNSDAWAWMNAIPAEYWSRSHFREGSKSDILLNNMSECFNKFILDARDKPILTMLEIIRCKIMVRIGRKIEGMKRWIGSICPKIKKKLDKFKEEAKYSWPSISGGAQFQVSCRYAQFVVDLAKHTCSCRKWQLTGIPCSHSCAVLAFNGNQIEDFVNTCYSVDAAKKLYEHIIYPMRSMEQWENMHHNPIQPPNTIPPKVGRPPKKRRREAGERQPTGKMRRMGMIMHCSKCGTAEHNKRACTNPSQSHATTTNSRSSRGRTSKSSRRGNTQHEGSSSNQQQVHESRNSTHRATN